MAAGKNTSLTLAMLEIHTDGKILDQQCDRFVRTMFSKAVEDTLRQNGSSQTRNFKMGFEVPECDLIFQRNNIIK